MVIALNVSQAKTIRATSGMLFAREPVRIAAAVVALVAGADDGADLAEETADRLQHLLAPDGVLLHREPLAICQRA